MDRVVLDIKKIDGWLNRCRCTLSADVNDNGSLLSMLWKVGFCLNDQGLLFCFVLLANDLTFSLPVFRSANHWTMLLYYMLRIVRRKSSVSSVHITRSMLGMILAASFYKPAVQTIVCHVSP